MRHPSTQDSWPPGDYYCPTCEKSYAVAGNCPLDNTRLVKLAAPLDPFIGKSLDARYTILEKLGTGGMGAVYRAEQHGLGREVAVKVVNAHLVSHPDVIKRFLREAKLASRLSHPNAVGVVDFGQTDDGVFYLVMELVTGRTLDALLDAEAVLPPERIVRIAAQICDALEGAHALQIIHRDLKPANIMLLAQGRDLVKVLDFGLAKSVSTDQLADSTMTNAGALIGTPAYMPPELARAEPCDGRADLYSLGVMLYRMGTGKLPFVAANVHELVAMQGFQPAPPMTGVPPALAHVVDRLLQKEPGKRFATAAETRDALEAAVDVGQRFLTPIPRAVASPPVVAPAPTVAPVRHTRRWLGMVIALSVLAAGGVAVVLATRGSKEPEQPTEALPTAASPEAEKATAASPPPTNPSPTLTMPTPQAAPPTTPTEPPPVVAPPLPSTPVMSPPHVAKPNPVDKHNAHPSHPPTKTTKPVEPRPTTEATKPVVTPPIDAGSSAISKACPTCPF